MQARKSKKIFILILNRLSLLRKNSSFMKMKSNMVSSCDHLLSKMQYFKEWWESTISISLFADSINMEVIKWPI